MTKVESAERRRNKRLTRLARVIDLLHPPAEGRIFEVRVLNIRPPRGRPYNASGYFDDAVVAAEAAIDYEQRGSDGVYLLLNRPDPLCFARAPNRILDYLDTTTSDTDIVRRRWLLLDVDPKRPRGVAATDDQVVAASEFAAKVKGMLAERFSWPEPVEAMSGNGQYLLFRIDLPNDEPTKVLLSSVLKGVNALMTCEAGQDDALEVRVDESTYNAARVIRLLGTQNRKGFSTEDQRHRRSRLLHVPKPLDVVPLGALQAVAEFAPQGKAAINNGHSTFSSSMSSGANGTSRLKVSEWLQDRDVPLLGTKATGDGRTAYLIQCPFDAGHGGHKETVVMQDAAGKMSAKCMHDSCTGRGWQDFKNKIGPPDAAHYDPPLAEGRQQAQPRAGVFPSGAFMTALQMGQAKRIVMGTPGEQVQLPSRPGHATFATLTLPAFSSHRCAAEAKPSRPTLSNRSPRRSSR